MQNQQLPIMQESNIFGKRSNDIPIPHGHSPFVRCVRLTHKNSPVRLLSLGHRIDSKIPVSSVSKQLAYRALEIRVDRSPSSETELQTQDTADNRHLRQNFVGPPFWIALLLLARKFRYLKVQGSLLCEESLPVYHCCGVTTNIVKRSLASNNCCWSRCLSFVPEVDRFLFSRNRPFPTQPHDICSICFVLREKEGVSLPGWEEGAEKIGISVLYQS